MGKQVCLRQGKDELHPIPEDDDDSIVRVSCLCAVMKLHIPRVSTIGSSGALPPVADKKSRRHEGLPLRV